MGADDGEFDAFHSSLQVERGRGGEARRREIGFGHVEQAKVAVGRADQRDAEAGAVRPASGWHCDRRHVEQVHEIGIVAEVAVERRSEERTSELQSLMRISYAVFCLKTKNK